MKSFIITITIFIIACFAFAKTCYAAVPSQAKSLKVEVLKDSILISESDFLMRQDSSEKKVQHLLQRARKCSNSAFVFILSFFTTFWLADIGLFYLAAFVGLGSILLGLILSLVALGMLIKVKGIITLFPEITKSDFFKENWRKSLVRSIVAASLFTGGVLLLSTIAVADSIVPGEFNRTMSIAGFGGALLLLLDRFGFKTK